MFNVGTVVTRLIMKSLEEGDNLVTCYISTPLYSAEQSLAETSHLEPPGYWFLSLSWSKVVCWEVEKLSTWKNPCQDCCHKKYSWFIPIKISCHSNLVITNYETRSEQLIGNTISRILKLIWSLNINVVEVILTFVGLNSNLMSLSSLLVFLILSTRLIVLWFSGIFSFWT